MVLGGRGIVDHIREYMRRRQAEIAEYAAGRPIYGLYIGAEWMEGSSSFLKWWDQDHCPNNTEREV